MRVINIVDDVRKVNFGIWSAAVITAPWLKSAHGVSSEIWFPAATAPDPLPDFYGATPVPLADTSGDGLKGMLLSRGLNPKEDVICTHGSWRYPTKWGHTLRKQGFVWVYVPQGMLEPWSMQQKALKKWLYFQLMERRMANQSSLIRAVATPEMANLKRHFRHVCLLTNGVPDKVFPVKSASAPYTVLFMARLHHKKGIVPLVQAWQASKLNKHPDWQLVIAGPDDGELANLNQLLPACPNARYVGSIYGAEKQQMLESAQYYILPTASEGFPTSIVESMQAGLVPLMSPGANFPEATAAGLGVELEQEVGSITKALNDISIWTQEQYLQRSAAVASFIQQNYTLDVVAPLQYKTWTELLLTNGKR